MKKKKQVTRTIIVHQEQEFVISLYNLETAYCRWYMDSINNYELGMRNNAAIYYAICEAMGLPYRELKRISPDSTYNPINK